MRRNFPAILLVLLAVLFVPGLVHGAILPVGEIVIEGASRTRHGVIRSALGIREGQPVETRELKTLETSLAGRLYKLRVFAEVGVISEVFPDRIRFVVRVAEKWTLLPIPFAAYYEKKFTFGVGLIESNFLGTLNMVGGLFLVQGGEPGGTLFTSWTFGGRREWVLVTGLRSMGREVELWDGKKDAGTYDERQSGGSLQLSRKFAANWRVGLKLEVNDWNFTDSPGYADATGIPVEVSLVHDGLVPVEDRSLGWQVRLAWLADTGAFGSSLKRSIASAAWLWSIPVGTDAALVLAQNYALGSGLAPGCEFRLGGRGTPLAPVLRGYHDDQFPTDAFMLSSVELRMPVWSTRGLIGSLVPFVDQALFREEGAAQSRFSSGLAFRIYLRRVAVPAFSVYLAWAEGNGKFSGGVSAGMQF